MKSHVYEFKAAEVLSLIVFPILFVVGFAVVMHTGAAFHLLPAPKKKLDMDQTILFHQAEASRSKNTADIVLVGDSSCMMDVSADLLAKSLPVGHNVLNLGTLSYLDLTTFGQLVQRYATANPETLQTLVVLLHPEMLRRGTAQSAHVAALEAMFEGTDLCDLSTWYGRFSCWLGLEIFRGRLLSQVLPAPLPANWGEYYGFTSGLRRYMSLHAGSAIDPRQYVHRAGEGNAEYRLTPGLEKPSRAFRAAIPTKTRLVIGIAPIPRGFAPPDYPKTYQDMLARWSEWMRADVTLTNLPSTLPDLLFASTTHLNEAGARQFTLILSRALIPHL